MQKTLLSILAAAWLCAAQAQTDNMDQFIEDLLSKMTLEEKVGQMNQYSGFWEATGPAPSAGNAKRKYEDLRNGRVGSVLNVRGVEEVRAMQKLVVEESRLGIPLIFASDIIHGYKTLAPIPLAEAASWDLKAIEASARMAATEASATGVSWTFAPMMDISRDARWGRVMEGGGEDTYLGSAIAAARIRGFQGEDLSANNTIMACAKHFAGYGFAQSGLDYYTADIGTATLHNTVLPPFRAAVEAGVGSFMNGFNLLNGQPVTGSSYLQRDLLKGKWGFEGVVVSDWASIAEMEEHGYSEDLKAAAKQAVTAGSDIDMESYAYINHLQDLVESGAVSESLVDDAVRRILRAKYMLGLFEDPYRYCNEEREEALLYNEAHQDAVLDMAKKSIVLLKNEGNLLPLKKEGLKITLIGQLANDKTSPLGSWRIGSDDGTAVSVLEGLSAYEGNEITFAEGPKLWSNEPTFVTPVEVNTTDRTGMAEAIEAAQNADVVIMVLGEHGFMSGEARSRTDISLPGLQQELLEKIYENNPNVVLVLNNGRPLTIPWAAERIPAIVEAWQLGSQTGHAVAQVLYGDYNPSGKLPMTFPRNLGQVPIHYNMHNTGRPNTKGDVFYTHYIDSPLSPLFPFGYGLSYTTFAYDNLRANLRGQSVEVTVKLTNTGDRAGEEVVQLYIRDRAASVVRPTKELKGFEKLMLQPGESRTVAFRLTPQELGFYMPDGQFVTEPGTFDIMVGPNSSDLLQTIIEWK
ncbi:beta-glucosidase BglX [Phaeodactylibacter sp.]|uniref:beta-glucosidase BglX n=1 Tax=Phaeodactylibacter sp. TaxID=1940289 RepID=UPI0025F72A18|nr:beta-glucosidase BglX [Phaeodactylibacter sp.]MCI4647734.1 beta-glucosidase BglX [Phaeodactylibacter sp.]MCI5093760.1 beta-glucosidase BglX [Phaeodactylibacter sp.]